MRCPTTPGQRPLRPTHEWPTDRQHLQSTPVWVSDIQPGLRWRLSHGVVGFAGELDLCTGPLLEGYFATHPGPARLDLRSVTFLDASGLHALERVRERCRANGWSFTIEHCSCPVARLLRLVGTYDELIHTAGGGEGDDRLPRR